MAVGCECGWQFLDKDIKNVILSTVSIDLLISWRKYEIINKNPLWDTIYD